MKKNTIFGTTPDGFHRLAYTEWGTPDSFLPPVICVHGLTRNQHDFDFIARFLSDQGRHVFTIDMAGRGDSEWFKNPCHYNFEQYIADVNVLIQRIGAQKIDLIGTSMGGLIGMMMAAKPNNPVRRLVMNDIGPHIPVKALWRLAKYAGKVPVFRSKEEVTSYFKLIYAEFGALNDEQWAYLTNHSIKQNANGNYEFKLDPDIIHSKSKMEFFKELLQEPRKALQGILFDIDLWPVWQQVKCPVLVVHGRQSDLLLADCIVKMQETNPLTDVFEVPDAGHAPILFELGQQEKIASWLNMN